MRIYTGYFLKNLFSVGFVTVFTLTSLVWLTQILRFVDLIVNKGLNFTTFLYLSITIIPSLLVIILPITCFLTILVTYNKFSNESELLIFSACGLSKYQIAKPAYIFAIVVTLMSYSISLYLLPKSYHEFKNTINYVKDNYFSVLLEEGVFNNPINGLTIYIEDRIDNGMLKGILINDKREKDKEVTIFAQKGKLINTPSGPTVDLINGNRQEINKNRQLAVLYFDNFSLEFQMQETSKSDRWLEVEERYINQLLFPSNERPEMIGRLKAEGHQRIVWPLYNIIFANLAVIAVLSGEFSRRGHWKKNIASSVLMISVIVLNFSISNFISVNSSSFGLIYSYIGTLIILSTLYLNDKITFFRNFKKS